MHKSPLNVVSAEKNKQFDLAQRLALNLLVRREHTQLELQRKLRQHQFSSVIIDKVLQTLIEQNWQSDQRFAENYIHQRSHKGFGPQRIAQELRKKGISSELVENALQQTDIDWLMRLRHLHKKKFTQSAQNDANELNKQKRFFYYRGFPSELIEQFYS